MPLLSKTSVENIIIDENNHDQRLDNYLIQHLKGVPKSHIYRIIRNGEVRINSKRCQQTYRLQMGDKIRIPPLSRGGEDKKNQLKHIGRLKTSIEKLIVFEDDYFLAINKTSGLAVHGGSGIHLGVIEQLRLERPEARFLELIHRLDRDTSGLLLIAKKRSFLVKIHELIRNSQVDKFYQTFVRGMTKNHQSIRLSLTKTQHSTGERQVRVDREGQTALTVFETVKHFEEGSLLRVQLITGRTHQIRVHLAHIGHPLAGDDKYGDFVWNRELHQKFKLKRLFLHSSELSFVHPLTNQLITLQAPLSNELKDFLKQMSPLA